MKTLATATALILCMTGAALAAETPTASPVLSGGPLYSDNEVNKYCFFINFGSTSITPMSQELFDSLSTSPVNSTSSCANGVAVAPNKTCNIAPTSALGGVVVSCKVTFTTAASKVRGAL